MVQVPQDQVTVNDLTVWFTMQEELKKLKASEMMLRKRIFGHYFPDPKEGTNTFVLPDDYQLKGKHTIQRDVDQGAYLAMNAKDPQSEKSQFEMQGINGDALVEWKPSLKLSLYRELTAEQQQFFDRCLLVKPGSPALEITPPAKKRGKAGEA